MSSQQQIPPRPDGLHPVPAMPPRPEALDVTDDGRPKATWSWYEALVVYFLAFLVAGLATLPLIRVMAPDTDLTNIVLSVVAAVVILAVLLLWLQLKHAGWLRVMGLPEPGTWRKQIGSGVLFGLGLYPVMVIVVGGLLTVLLQTISGEHVQAPEQVGEHLPAIGSALTIVYAIVIAPIGEELFFRGFAQTAWTRDLGWRAALVRTAVFFALVHAISTGGSDFSEGLRLAVVTVVARLPVAFGLGWVFARTGSIAASVGLHAGFNGLMLVLAALLLAR